MPYKLPGACMEIAHICRGQELATVSGVSGCTSIRQLTCSLQPDRRSLQLHIGRPKPLSSRRVHVNRTSVWEVWETGWV